MRVWFYIKNYLTIAVLLYIAYKLFAISLIPTCEEEYEKKSQQPVQDDQKFDMAKVQWAEKILSNFTKKQAGLAENYTNWNSLLNAMPHLYHVDPTLLQPIYLLGKRSARRKMVIAIPAIERPKEEYLLETLKSLFAFLTPEDRTNVTLIIFLSNEKGENSTFVRITTRSIKQRFEEEINSELLQVVLIPVLFYPPNLDKIKATFNDSERRMYWRTRQNIDYLYAMSVAALQGDYYLQLEDDINAAKGYLKNINYFIEINNDWPWTMLEFSSLGCIGKLYSPEKLHRYIDALGMFFDIKPVDWIFDDLHRTMYCSPEWGANKCRAEINKYRIAYEPVQFQHLGKYSSLRGKIQRLKEKKFGMVDLKKKRNNPSASLSTNMAPVDNIRTFQNAYLSSAFFFTNKPPQARDYLEFIFDSPIKLKGILLTTGNTANPGLIVTEEAVVIAIDEMKQAKEIGRFDQDGRIFARNFYKPVRKLRVEIQQNLNNSVIFDQIAFTLQ